ncbi:MAG: hypothetical protein KGJ62_06645 [Armatimonadetes bacterium]|nr:hypothetical protein [Armatimonadota bacterium]MDE2207576.1 hypothetical protein [Armatimonadota bacterium]
MPPHARPTLHFRDGACLVTADGIQVASYRVGGAEAPALMFAAAPETAPLLGSRLGPGCAFEVSGCAGEAELTELLGRRGSVSCGLKLSLQWRRHGSILAREERTVRFEMVSEYSLAIDTLVQIWDLQDAAVACRTKLSAAMFGWFTGPLLESPAAVIQAPDGDHDPPAEFNVKSSWIAATGAPGGQPATILLTTGLPGGEAAPRWSVSPDGGFRADLEPVGESHGSAPCEWFSRIVLHNGAVNRAWCEREAKRSREALAESFAGIAL